MGGAEVGDVGERVDAAGVGGAGGGGDQEWAWAPGEGFPQCGEVHDAGGGGDDDGFGQAEEPGGAGDAVVGVGGADGLYGAVALAGEEECELVGLGAAGGDECVGGGPAGVDLGGQGGGDVGFEGGGGGGLVPGVHGGVEGGGGEVGRGGEGQGRGVEVGGAEGVGGVRGAFGEGGDQGAQGLVGAGAVVGDDGVGGGAHPGVTASGPPAGRGPSRLWAPSRSAVRTVSMRGRRAAGPVVVPARGGVGMAWALRMRVAGHGWTYQLVRVFGGAAVEPGDVNSKGGRVVGCGVSRGVPVVWVWPGIRVCPASPVVGAPGTGGAGAGR